MAEGYVDGGRGAENDAELGSKAELENWAVDLGQIGERLVEIAG